MNALGGMWSGSVSSIPGTGAPWLVVGCGGVAELTVVDAAGAPARTALPSVALTHPESRATATRHAAPGIGQIGRDGISVTRKGQRQFLFQVFVGSPGEVDCDLSDGAAGERERRFVAAGHRRPAVTPDRGFPARPHECSQEGLHIRPRAD